MVSRSPAKQTAFLAAFAECACITRAAEAAKVARASHYKWLRDDPEYPARFEEARTQSVDVLIAEATRRAKDGTERLKFHQGELIRIPLLDADGAPVIDPESGEPRMTPYVERQYSDTMLIFLLKAADPTRFNDRLMVESQQTIQHSGTPSPEEVRAVVREMHKHPDYLDYIRQKTLEDHHAGRTPEPGDHGYVDWLNEKAIEEARNNPAA